jgi:hypothetical protein
MAAAKRREQFQREKQELRSILREDILGKKPADGARPADSESTKPRIVWETDTNEVATEPKPRKGFGRLFREEKDKDTQERITVEE